MRCRACGSSDVSPPGGGDYLWRCVECGQGHGVLSSPRNPSAHLTVYLGSPGNREQAEAAKGMPVLLSYAATGRLKYIGGEFAPTYSRILVDSGAFSELNTGAKVDLSAYADWAQRWLCHADTVAGLDDISGDWRRSLANYEAFPEGFPTFHETDPPGLLDDLIAMARERGGWLGLGLLPPRSGKERWVRDACERVPEDLHLHGWALRGYTGVRRLDSVDSTEWFRRAMEIRTLSQCRHLTYGECLEIVVKRYQRWRRQITEPPEPDPPQKKLFG